MLRLSTYVVKGRLSRAFPHTCRASSPQSHPIPSHCLTSQVCLFSLPSLTPILCLSIHLFALLPASSPLTPVIKPVGPCFRPTMPGWSPIRLKDPPGLNCQGIPSLSLKITKLVEDWNGPLGVVVSPSGPDCWTHWEHCFG